ncbi:pyridoxamine 5'-phosphate oxidase family protein [Bacteroides sp. f07]|uniref:pyridoxamine 5'-phosphate oxidase family protein n=1 Tax=Bacteroides sp. f07 TaxID=3132704 RepID=UPI0034B4B6CB
MTAKTMKEKAVELLQRCEVVTLASVNKEGYPRPVPMSKISAEGISTIWMSTGADSLKTLDFLSNPKAGLCFQDKGDSVALTGTVEVVTDEKMKKELWQDWFIEHFPGGPADPGYVLLKFESNYATYWIEGTFIHKNLG